MASPVMPVVGVSIGDVADTFGADRDGGARSHRGVDIFAERGTPVVAAVGGTINGSSYGDSRVGGNRVWVEGDDGRAYYYAHLDSIDVEPGQRVEAGGRLGTVGNTGNAVSTPPHLHFSVSRAVGPEDGSVNPYEFLSGAVDAGQVEVAPQVPEVPDYPTDPAPLTAAVLREFAERRRRATRDLQEAMAARERGSQEDDSRFRTFLRQLEDESHRRERQIGSEVAARNLAFQPAAQGRALRDLQEDRSSMLGSAAQERSNALAALEQAVNLAERQREETIASIDRDAGRAGASFEQLFGAR